MFVQAILNLRIMQIPKILRRFNWELEMERFSPRAEMVSVHEEGTIIFNYNPL